mgnify:FL=1
MNTQTDYSLKECSDAWFAVVAALHIAKPGFLLKRGTGQQCAVKAINEMRLEIERLKKEAT